MMKFFVYIEILLIIGVTVSCTSDTTNQGVIQEINLNGETVKQINMDAIPDEVTRIGLSRFFAGMDVILLESNSEAYAQNAMIHFADDFFLLGTQHFPGPARILRFDYEGNFLNRIGQDGEGPGEHTGYSISVLEYSEETRTVLVSWSAAENAQLFRPDGTFIRDIISPMHLMSPTNHLSEDEWFTLGSTAARVRFARDSVKVIFYTSDGDITKQINRTAYPPEGSREYTPWGNSSGFSFNGNKKAYFPEDHTIYRIEDRKLIPETVIRPGENILPFNQLTTPKNTIDSNSLSVLSETDRNWFIKQSTLTNVEMEENTQEPGRWGGFFETSEQMVVIDKETKNGARYQFIDDLLYILPEEFSHELIPWQSGFGAYLALPAHVYLEFLESSDNLDQRSAEVLQKLEVLDGLTEDDNFIIFIFRFKDEIILN